MTGARCLGVEVPLLLQFSIALFTGMVAATFVPPVRRAIPKPVEVALWIALITVCAVGITSVTDPNVRELSSSAVWGVDQMINASVGAVLGGVLAWVVDHRFSIASWLVIVAGSDLLALVLIRSRRSAELWQPRVRLREWMEMPLAPVAGRQPVPVEDPVADLNRRVAAGMAIAGTTMLTNVLDFSIWVRDVLVPHQASRFATAARSGRTRSRARLESLRDSAAHLQHAAMSWYAAAGHPAVSGAVQGLAGRASAAARQANQARRALGPVTARAGQVVDVRAVLNAQSIGWYGPLMAAPTTLSGEEEDDDAESTRPDRLAS